MSTKLTTPIKRDTGIVLGSDRTDRMPKFVVDVEWVVCGSATVEAEDFDSARSNADKLPLDTFNAGFMSGSFEIRSTTKLNEDGTPGEEETGE